MLCRKAARTTAKSARHFSTRRLASGKGPGTFCLVATAFRQSRTCPRFPLTGWTRPASLGAGIHRKRFRSSDQGEAMEATRPIRQDHDLLRKKLALLESALQVAPEARFVLREMCFSLQHLLHDHIAREQSVLPPDRTNHQDAHSLLRTVNELLLGGMRASMPTAVLWLSKLIALLR